jgi:hypothetical protein
LPLPAGGLLIVVESAEIWLAPLMPTPRTLSPELVVPWARPAVVVTFSRPFVLSITRLFGM